jgi:hypothetical protein
VVAYFVYLCPFLILEYKLHNIKIFAMLKTLPRITLLFTLCLFLISWGSVGHQTISYKVPNSFTSTMTGFSVWSDSLKLHASDADNRKNSDPTESPKHFIDIDNYAEFKTNGRIVSTYDSLIALHGASTVNYNGTLPYATRTTYDSLKNCFKKLQWHKAMLFASDLGHYVADGHMPFHITANYDGNLTGNSGIHSRYETSLVSNYVNSLNTFQGSPVSYISNVNNYIFTYIYQNYHYVDSVIIADNYAKSLPGNSGYSGTYYSALWSKTKFTTTLFKNASHAIAELIYSAWTDAGSPPFGAKKFPDAVDQVNVLNVSIYPNPTKGIINVIGDNVQKAEITSLEGKLVEVFYQNHYNLNNLSNGIYILNLYGKNGLLKREKIVLTK